ncbi:MAG: hypothetical protein FWG34_06790 [Oscillospiraceae bacterium]|nr:hypothetical protein [Oscillospiraceae bacterium]
MNDFFAGLSAFQAVFFVISLSSTVILVIQTILALVGISNNNDAEIGESYLSDGHADADGGAPDFDADAEVSADHDLADDADDGGGDGELHDAHGLRLFTVRGIMAFLMMGSWVGFFMSRAGANEILSLFCAFASGSVTLVFMAKLMQIILGMQEDGTTKLKNALGQTGQVYIKIPGAEKGKGKVNVTVQEKLCEFEAVTEQGETIKTGEIVYVTDIRSGNVLVVEKVKDE